MHTDYDYSPEEIKRIINEKVRMILTKIDDEQRRKNAEREEKRRRNAEEAERWRIQQEQAEAEYQAYLAHQKAEEAKRPKLFSNGTEPTSAVPKAEADLLFQYAELMHFLYNHLYINTSEHAELIAKKQAELQQIEDQLIGMGYKEQVNAMKEKNQKRRSNGKWWGGRTLRKRKQKKQKKSLRRRRSTR